ncbi:MAG: hypothetical protein F6K36_13000 [Symploca sp. SIO3C6]|nr:hypothetical protein [Symploca sp. SIO3C6]
MTKVSFISDSTLDNSTHIGLDVNTDDFQKIGAQLEKIPEILNKTHTALSEIEHGIQNADKFLKEAPLFGDNLTLSSFSNSSLSTQTSSSQTSESLNFIGEIRNTLDEVLQEIKDFSEDATIGQIKDVFFEQFGSAGLKLIQNRNDIGITLTDDKLKFDLKLNSDLPSFERAIDTDLGVPGLNLSLEDNSKVQLDFDYEFDFSFGINQNEFFFDTPLENDIEIDVSTSFSNLDIDGELGFLQIDVIDNLENPSLFELGLDIDLSVNNGIPSVAMVNPTGSLNLNLDLMAGLEDDEKEPIFPSISTDFSLSWEDFFGNPSSDPEIAFNNVQLELGSFLSGFAEPIINAVDKIIAPFEPIRKVLTTNIPGLDDIGIEINLLNLAGVPNNSKLFDAIDQFGTIIEAVSTAQDTADNLSESDLFIDLGSFTANVNGEIVTSNPNQDTLQQAEAKGFSFFTDVKDIPGGGLSFPLFDTPTEAFNLLLNKDVDLLNFQLPEFGAGFDFKKKIPLPVPLPIPVFVNYDFDANFTSPGIIFGYDTAGIRNGAPFQGFFVNGSNPLFEVDAEISGGVSAGVPKIAEAGGDAFIKGEVDFYLPGRQEKARIQDLVNSFSDNNFFDADGSVTAGASIWAEHITFNPIKGFLGILTGDFDKLVDRYEKNLVTFDIFDFGGSSDAPTPEPPNLATLLNNGELRLNMGRFANERNINQDIEDENFSVTSNVIVSAFGEQETYSNISKIIAYADTGNDVISIEANVIAELHGGLGEDNLYGGSQNDLLFGERGADRLVGNSGNDQLHGGEDSDRLYGDEGNDQLLGEAGDDLLDGGVDHDLLLGGDGEDTLIGGVGNDSLEGEDKNDSLFGGDGNDILQGDNGNDLLVGGSGEDSLDGGKDNDRLFGEVNNDELIGGIGNDLLDGGEGNDTLKGGDGNDQLFGGFRVIVEPIFDDNGQQVLDENGQPVFTTPEFLDDSGHDFLDGGEGEDKLDGGAGNDFLVGGAGNDLIEGGNDIDTVSYEDSPSSVVVNLDESRTYQNTDSTFHISILSASPIPTDLESEFAIDSATAKDGFGTTDTLRNLENIIGSEHNDILIGNSLDNRIEALAGNDLLIGNAGNDYLDGGADIDTVSYRRDPGSVEVNLAQNQAKDGFGNTDQIYNVENVIGSAFDDEIIGDANDNTIYAGAGKDKVSGDAGNDTLFGEDGNDTLNGDAGDDYLVGGTGNGWPSDILNGGSGNDTASYITATSGVAASLEQKIGWQGDATGDQFISIENLEGSNFNDFLIGDNGANILSGLDGNDTLEGRDGDDTLNGGEGNNILNAGEGNNTVEAGSGNDNVYAGTGNDNIFTNGGNDEIHAGDGNNTINAGNGTNKIYAGNGYDSISAGTGDDEIYAGDGGSTIFAGAGNNQVYTGNGYDSVEAEDGDDLISVGNGGSNIDAGDGTNTVYAGTGDDQLYTGTGDDEIHVGEGNNNVDAGSGNNIISAGSGNDVIDTGAGDDTIYANEGLNTVRAGDGNNQIYSGSGGDFLFAGTGDDQIYAGEGQNYIDAGNGDNTIYSGSASDFILVGNGNDLIYAGEGSNHISAGNGDNTIYADAGSDQISTGSGNDLIYAGEGNNLIATGTGFDTVYVGSGFDRFSLSEGLGEVTIYGFQANQDSFIGAGPLDLSISGNDTLVTLNSSGDLLAIVKDLQLV